MTADCGVIVGRFQVNELHAGHIALLEYVCGRHAKVIVVLGCAPVLNTRKNPLDFESRKQMVQGAFPGVTVVPLADIPDDQRWCENLDHLINLLCPIQSVALYGGRDSFLSCYLGRYPTEYFEHVDAEVTKQISATQTRRIIGTSVISNADFRAGVIWAAHNRFPTTFPTVDIAVFDEGYEAILLGRKQYEGKWRLVGGFADPRNYSYEEDAIRELKEETGLELKDDPVYVGSFAIDDWRYDGEQDNIRTILFTAVTDDPTFAFADDDLVEVKWFTTKDLFEHEKLTTTVMPLHVRLVEAALDSIKSKVSYVDGQPAAQD